MKKICIILISAFVGCMTIGVNAQVLNPNPGFEDGTWRDDWRRHAQNSSDAVIEVVNSPVRNGNYSLHLQHQYKGSGISNRCEIGCETYISSGTPNGGYIRWHEEVWIGFSVYLQNWDEQMGTWNGIMQVHSIPGDRDWSVLASADAWYIKGNDGFFDWSDVGQPNIYIDTRRLSNPYDSSPPSSDPVGTPLWWMPIEEANNKWIDFVGNFIISPDGDGKMRWWVNGELVIDFTGPNVYYYDTGGNPAVQEVIVQTGSYKSPSSSNLIDMYYDEIRFGNENATYSDVAPRGSEIPNNTPPYLSEVITPDINRTVIEGNVLNIPLYASDEDGDILNFSISPAISFVTLIDNGDGTGNLRIAPDPGDAGVYDINITVSDSNGGQDSQTITIIVDSESQSTNTPPILANVITPDINRTIIEGNLSNIPLSASDDDGDALEFYFSPNFDFVNITNNNDGTGNLEVSPNVGDAGIYDIIITVRDTKNGSDSETITLIVESESLDNSLPVIAPIGDQSLIENTTIEIPVSATDADGDNLSFSMSPNIDFISLTYNTNGTGTLTVSPTIGDNGVYSIVLIVTDIKGGSDFETIVITVEKTEDTNSLPILSTIGDQRLTEAESLRVSFSAVDPDGDALSYSMSPIVDFITLTDHGDGTGSMSINPVVGDAGTYSFTIRVSDVNNGTDSESFMVIVDNNLDVEYVNIINSGGNSTANSGLLIFDADDYYTGGQTADRGEDYEINGTEYDELYQSVRYGDFEYNIPVPKPGKYTLKLHFAEITFTGGETGSRIFNVFVEDEQEVMINYDINADVGPRMAVSKTFTGIIVEDGKITVSLETVVRNALLSGIEIISETDDVTQLESDFWENKFKIYPNPSNGMFAFELETPDLLDKEIPYEIYDIAGNMVDKSMFSGQKEIIDISRHGKGIYILKVGSFVTEKVFVY